METELNYGDYMWLYTNHINVVTLVSLNIAAWFVG